MNTVSQHNGWRKEELDTPAVVVDIERLERNIQTMSKKVRESGINLRPHAKAHKTVAIAQRQIATGAIGVAVAKVGEAEVMAAGGIRDIMITTPVVGSHKLERLRKLAHQIKISVVLDSLEAGEAIADMARKDNLQIDVLLEIDTGLGRCGVQPGAPAAEFARGLANMSNLHFVGLKTAELQVYAEHSQTDVARVENEVAKALCQTVEAIEKQGIEVPIVCAGSTAAADITRQLDVITEMHTGSYVFNSLDGVATGAATLDDCAMTLQATVISKPAPDRAVIDAGFKALSLVTVPGWPGFGYIKPYADGATLERLYEEHGVIRFAKPTEVAIGDLVEIIPCSCSVIPNLFDEMAVVRGDKVEAIWPIEARGKVR